MIAIRGLALAAVAGASAIALAPRAAAQSGREMFTIEVRYDASRTALDNYIAFARQVERACEQRGVRGLLTFQQERVCMRETMDKLVAGMDRAELGDIHALRFGRRADSSRQLAER